MAVVDQEGALNRFLNGGELSAPDLTTLRNHKAMLLALLFVDEEPLEPVVHETSLALVRSINDFLVSRNIRLERQRA